MTIIEKLDNFMETMADYGDIFFTMGSVQQDYEAITSRIKLQGYWSGDSLRYFFDEDLKLIRTEERKFGS